MFRSALCLILALCSLLCAPPAHASGGMLEIRNGYFWDPQVGDYFVPRGIAYQIWNPPVGANQSLEQLDYDLLEFKKIYANSVRCEMVWGELEVAEGQYDWSKPDHLVAQAEKLGFKLFVLIGFQYPPAWFPRELRGINAEGLTPKAMARLATNTPAAAFSVFPPRTVQQLEKAVPAEFRSLVQDALVQGAKANSVTKVLELLEAHLPSAIATAVSKLMISDVINWEHPDARAKYARHMAAVTAHYKNSSAIGAWIMGNEYAYFDLWEDPDIYGVHRFIGFDGISQDGFRQYLRQLYRTNIAALNANWGSTYADFTAVEMPEAYPEDRFSPGYHDLLQWRKDSIGDFIAAGAKAARQVDPHHLQTYSMVGGVFSGRDANNTAEDAKAIVARCRAAGAPLDFWSINNYANAAIGSELRSADFGVGKYQAESGLPVMISETGHSSTENLFDKPDAGKRQPKAVPGQIWESLLSGAIGTHLFHWSDRSQYTEQFFLRERGFGIVDPTRKPKPEVYTNVVNMFRRMEELDLNNLLGASRNPPVDVQFFWSTNSDMVWPRANQENAMLWGSLKRVGYQPGIIDDAAFETGAWSNAPVLLLSRAYQMNPAHLDAIAARVLPAGIHVHSNADLPGQFDAFQRPNPNWTSLMKSIFGIDTSHAVHALHAIVSYDFHAPLTVTGVATLPPITPGYTQPIISWDIWDNVVNVGGTLVAQHGGVSNAAPNSAALVIKNHARAKTAITTFALGDSASLLSKEAGWEFRFDWLQAIYGSHFELTPAIQLTGTSSKFIIPDYRILRNGSILLSLLNEGTNSATVNVSAAGLLRGKTVENLTSGGIVERDSDGLLELQLTGDDYVLLYAYNTAAPSLVQPTATRVWFESAPGLVHPRELPYIVRLGFDTLGGNLQLGLNFEHADGTPVSRAPLQNVSGKSTRDVAIAIPDFDPENPEYLSSGDGGDYLLRAALWSDGNFAGESVIPVRLAWPVRPLSPLPSTISGRQYTAQLEWEELPAADPNDPTPFDRARLWGAIDPANYGYAISLNLLGANGTLVASNRFLTRQGSGTNALTLNVPVSAQGPFTWVAEARPIAGLQTHDVFESFEANERGAKWPDDLAKDFLAPWHSFKYPGADIAGIDLWQNEGVQLKGSAGSQSAFLVITNPVGLAVSTFGLTYQFPGGPWPLPENRALWTNYTLSFDFKEDHLYAAQLEMQIKNDDPNGEGKWLQKGFTYAPGSNGWMRVRANLAEFEPPDGLFGVFEPAKLKEIVLGVRMLTSGVQYVGSFDNIQFDGPDTITGTGTAFGSYASANDSAGFLNISLDDRGRVQISWTGPGRLQAADNANGPWEFVSNPSNPQSVVISTPRRFYRLLR